MPKTPEVAACNRRKKTLEFRNNVPLHLPWDHFNFEHFNRIVLSAQTFTNDSRLVGDNIHMLRMGLRDIKQPFYLARMMFSDEIKSRTKMTQVSACAKNDYRGTQMCTPSYSSRVLPIEQ